jgi:hypothetical protein
VSRSARTFPATSSKATAMRKRTAAANRNYKLSLMMETTSERERKIIQQKSFLNMIIVISMYVISKIRFARVE